jgi:hypothetical protein
VVSAVFIRSFVSFIDIYLSLYFGSFCFAFQPPIQLVKGALPLGVKWPGREADHSPPSRAEVKE